MTELGAEWSVSTAMVAWLLAKCGVLWLLQVVGRFF